MNDSGATITVVFGTDQHVCSANIARNTLAFFSGVCAQMLEEDADTQTLFFPFVSDERVIQILLSFFHTNQIVLVDFAPRVLFDTMMAANGMCIQPLLDKTIDEIARRWQESLANDIREQWGLNGHDLPLKDQIQIALENAIMFPFENAAAIPPYENTQDIKTSTPDWGWPLELLTLVLEKLPTPKLAAARAVSVECFNLITNKLLPRGDCEIQARTYYSLLPSTLGFAERHCVMMINQAIDLDLVRTHSSSSHPVHHLHIVHSTLTRQDKQAFHALSQLVGLQTLTFGACNALGLYGARAISSLTRLQCLKIGMDNEFGEEQAQFLAPLVSLTHLTIGNRNGLGAKGVCALASLVHLQRLEIGEKNHVGASLDALSRLVHLQHLVVGGKNGLGVEGARAIATLVQLRRLEIGCFNAIGADGVHVLLSSLDKLDYLSIGGGNNLVGMAPLSSPVVCLQHVRIGERNGFGPDGIEALSLLKNLKRLDIGEGNQIGEQGCRALSSLTSLRHLKIGNGNNLGSNEGSGIHAWASSLVHLQELEIGDENNIGGNGAWALSRLIHLKRLVIGFENHLGEEGAKAISCLTNLTELRIGGENEIGKRGVKAISSLVNLECLEIGNENGIGRGVKAISSLSNLRDLTIGYGNKIGVKGARALSQLKQLRRLDIGDENKIGVEGAKAISCLTNLTELRIGDENEIGEEGAKAISSLVGLTYLAIGMENNIGDKGAQALGCLTNLQKLCLYEDGNDLLPLTIHELQSRLPKTRIE